MENMTEKLDKGDQFGPHLDLSVRSIQRRCYFAAAGRAGGIMKPSTTDKGGPLTILHTLPGDQVNATI